MPSPTWSTVPTSERSVSTSYCSIRCLRIEVISSGRSFSDLSFLSQVRVTSSWRSRSRRPRTLASTRSEPAWRIMPPISSGSTAARRLDGAAGGLLDLRDDRRRLVVGELVGGGQLDARPGPAPRRRSPRTPRRSRGADPPGPSRRRGGGSCARSDRLRSTAPRARRLRRRVELRVREEGRELGRRLDRVGELASSVRATSTRSCSWAASKSARAYMRCATAIGAR